MSNRARDKEKIFANTREMLDMARSGLSDYTSGDPRKRRAGLMNLCTYGRSVTLTMQTMRNTDPDFDAWWEPFQDQMRRDPLMSFFNDLRTKVLHEGELSTSTYTVIGAEGPVDLGALVTELNQHAPPNTVATFFGEGSTGGNGWEVRMPDESTKKVYFQLPESSGIESGLYFQDPPTHHYGTPITDTSIPHLGRLYLETLSEMVEEFIRRFQE